MCKKTESNPNSVENSYLFWQSAVRLARKPSCVQVTLLANISKSISKTPRSLFVGKNHLSAIWVHIGGKLNHELNPQLMPLQSLPSMIGHLRWQCDSTFSTRGGFLMPVFFTFKDVFPVKTLLAPCLNWEAVLRSVFVLLTGFH